VRVVLLWWAVAVAVPGSSTRVPGSSTRVPGSSGTQVRVAESVCENVRSKNIPPHTVF
jgi:hypothetical protein